MVGYVTGSSPTKIAPPFQGSQTRFWRGLWKLEATLLWTFLLLGACERGPQVVIHTQQGDVAVGVEVADTPQTRSYGLMYRKDLGADAGMLFVFPEEEEQTFWMKNTPLPLDMIFIGKDLRIVGIVANATPFTTSPRSAHHPSQYVLEVHGGFAEKHSIATGDRIELRNIAHSATK